LKGPEGVFAALCANQSQNYGAYRITQCYLPPDTGKHVPAKKAGTRFIYPIPHRGGTLSWPGFAYWDGLPVSHPDTVLTGPGIGQLATTLITDNRVSGPCHYVKPANMIKIAQALDDCLPQYITRQFQFLPCTLTYHIIKWYDMMYDLHWTTSRQAACLI